MSDLNLDNIVGFKAVDKDGNEQNVTVDEMVDMVSTRMVMALSETSTFAAVAATGNDVYENELPTVTDAANVRVLQNSGDAAQMTMQSLASKLGGLLQNPYSTNKGLLPSGTDLNDVTENGLYRLNGGSYINLAGNSYGILSVLSYPNFVIYQKYVAALSTGGNTYIRQYYGGVWTEWVKLN